MSGLYSAQSLPRTVSQMGRSKGLALSWISYSVHISITRKHFFVWYSHFVIEQRQISTYTSRQLRNPSMKTTPAKCSTAHAYGSIASTSTGPPGLNTANHRLSTRTTTRLAGQSIGGVARLTTCKILTFTSQHTTLS